MTELRNALCEIGSNNGNKIKVNPDLLKTSIIYVGKLSNDKIKAKALSEIDGNDVQTFKSIGPSPLDGISISQLIESGYIEETGGILFAKTDKITTPNFANVNERRLFAAIYCQKTSNDEFVCNVAEGIKAFTIATEFAKRNKLV
jgi:hypothetical protein